MKKIMFFLVVIFIVFLLFSCPSEIVKKTHWKGALDATLGDFDAYADSLEFFMRNDNTMRAIVNVHYNAGYSIDYAFDGTYILNNDYTFQADLENDDGDIKIELEGVLNTTIYIGNGDCKWKWASNDKYDGDWEVSRVY